jgi:large subunit ribosomal protein L17
MRHRKSGRKLKRTSSHRRATLSALCTALIRHKKIKTTVAKAKETRMVVEKILTRAKNAVAGTGDAATTVHARRQVARYINDRKVVQELFTEIAPKIASRPGGYTRVVKLGQRAGDGGEVAVLELVDFNTGEAPSKQTKKDKKKEKAKDEPKRVETGRVAAQ